MDSDATETLQAAMTAAKKMQLASAIASRIQIKDVKIVETSARQSLRRGELPTRLELSVNTDASLDLEAAVISVDVRCTLASRYAEPESDAQSSPLSVVAVFRLEYAVDSVDGITGDGIDAFGEVNGVYNVWPYWREYVQSILVRMGLPRLTIPVFRPKSDFWPIVKATQFAPEAAAGRSDKD
jgi:preprotein translocase subunit SecB